jgi:hypothetical protein
MCKFRHSREKWSRLEKSEDDEERGNDLQENEKVYGNKTRRSNNWKIMVQLLLVPQYTIEIINATPRGEVMHSYQEI